MVCHSTMAMRVIAFVGAAFFGNGMRLSKEGAREAGAADSHHVEPQVTSVGPGPAAQPRSHPASPAGLPPSGPVLSTGASGARNFDLEDAKGPAIGSAHYTSPVADVARNGSKDQGKKKTSLEAKSKLGKTKIMQAKKPWWAFWEKDKPPEDMASLEGNAEKPERRFVKVRLFWVRHGLSCANVMDKCSKGPSDAEKLLPMVEKALQKVPNLKNAKVKQSFGLQPSEKTEGDCRIEVEAPGLVPGQVGDKGAIIRVHDLYTDPALTDCARQQSTQAGRSFMKWLQRKGIKIHFTGSSFLMRAVQTSYGMFREPCGNTEGLDCKAVFVGRQPLLTPVPYMTERAPPGHSSLQQDNMPMSVDKQQRAIEKIHGKKLPVDSSFTRSWPRVAQQYEKFKAFLAVVLAPSIGEVAFWRIPPIDVFRKALEATLPESMHPEDHGKEPITVAWEGGQYQTGADFDKEEYTDLEAPELNLVIVGHNQMMSEYCLAPEMSPKPNNNAILEKLFIMELPENKRGHQTITMRELRGKCALVMDAPSKETSWSNLSPADVINCRSPFHVSDFMDLKDGGGPSSNCVDVAPESAFPIQPGFV